MVADALLLATNFVHSRVGRALHAIATDEASGIPVASYNLRLFIPRGGLSRGAAEACFSFSSLILSPEAFPIVLSIQSVVVVAVGGLGDVYGRSREVGGGRGRSREVAGGRGLSRSSTSSRSSATWERGRTCSARP